MKNLSIILLTLSFFISSSVFAGDTIDQVAKIAKRKTAEFVQVLNLSKDEEEKVYQILLYKQHHYASLKNEYKADKKAFRAAAKPINVSTNRQLKEIIGAGKMKKMNQFKRAQRSANQQ